MTEARITTAHQRDDAGQAQVPAKAPQHSAPQPSSDALEQARREKLQRWRDELGLQPYGFRVDGLAPLDEARTRFDRAAHEAHAALAEQGEIDPAKDPRSRTLVAGRVVQHRVMGKLVFFVLRDHTGDLQISVSKSLIDQAQFMLASKLDYGDIVVAGGPVGATQRGEICIWADRVEVHCKSLAPPPEKFHGLTDPELRYRQRYVDMYANPETIRTFKLRSQLVSRIRRFMDAREFLEVETPILQSIAGGAAARPFITHHNTLDIDLYLRIATELPLKRLLVGGMPRVYEIGRIFRNEGVDRTHNPEFTTIEAYQAFGDCWSMLELTEALLHELAASVSDGQNRALSFGEIVIDWSRPFARVRYDELFAKIFGFDLNDRAKVREAALQHHVKDAAKLDHWLLVNKLFEEKCETALDGAKPTFITDYPSAISPLTRPQADHPHLAERWELLVAGMELGTAYTELNDPDVQRAKLTEQLAGADEEESTFRTLDEDFLESLKVGMPPAGGLGLGVDRIIMLMTNQQSIRDVILFPLMRPAGGE